MNKKERGNDEMYDDGFGILLLVCGTYKLGGVENRAMRESGRDCLTFVVEDRKCEDKDLPKISIIWT